MTKIGRGLLALALALGLSVAVAPAAYADTCGATVAEWVPALGSTWSGSAGSNALLLAEVPLLNAAATTVGVLPLTGQWSVNIGSASMLWSGATGGFSYLFQVNATACAGGKVTAAEGAGQDSVFNTFAVTLSRVT